jgi:hypothetical protein
MSHAFMMGDDIREPRSPGPPRRSPPIRRARVRARALTLRRARGITARMVSTCDECGSHNVVRRHVHDRLIEECGLCGHLQGDPADVAAVEEVREAERDGVAPELVGLMRTLDSIAGLKVDRRLTTAAGHALPPAVYFAVGSHGLEVLDRLARTLLLATRRTSTLWTVEATHQGRLLFVLRPRHFVPAEAPDEAVVHPLVRDLGLLRDALRRDLNLPWWELSG